MAVGNEALMFHNVGRQGNRRLKRGCEYCMAGLDPVSPAGPKSAIIVWPKPALKTKPSFDPYRASAGVPTAVGDKRSCHRFHRSQS